MNSNIQQLTARVGAFIHRREQAFVALCSITLLGVGATSFPDYGISFDEPVSRTNGAISLRYVAEKNLTMTIDAKAND